MTQLFISFIFKKGNVRRLQCLCKNSDGMFLGGNFLQFLRPTISAQFLHIVYYFSTHGTSLGDKFWFAFGRGFPSKMAILGAESVLEFTSRHCVN